MDSSKIEFSSLILGLNSAALSYLGLSEENNNIHSEAIGRENLELAAQNIEIISLLLEKTKGNLLPEEDTLIRNILADLHTRFAHVAGNSPASKKN